MKRPVVIVTGLSGAGRATMLNMLEDMGFETVDNPPLNLLESALGDGALPIAVGVDTRSRGFAPEALLVILERLRLRPDIDATLLFATADDSVLLRRYTETRRRHPLAPGGALSTSVADGIARETALLAPPARRGRSADRHDRPARPSSPPAAGTPLPPGRRPRPRRHHHVIRLP